MSAKSGLMVGLGESFDEMVEAFGILREHGVQVLTVGQYLRPTESHLPVERYWHPDEFAALEKAAYELGFESVASGPLVRSSYHADEQVPDRRAAVAWGASRSTTAPLASTATTVGDRDPILAREVGALADVERQKRRLAASEPPLPLAALGAQRMRELDVRLTVPVEAAEIGRVDPSWRRGEIPRSRAPSR